MIEPTNLGDLVDTSVANTLDAAERPEQITTLRRSDAGDLKQLRGHGSHRPPLAVVGDGETMGLVASLLKQAQPGRAAREAQRVRASGNEDLFLTLREADERKIAQP